MIKSIFLPCEPLTNGAGGYRVPFGAFRGYRVLIYIGKHAIFVAHGKTKDWMRNMTIAVLMSTYNGKDYLSEQLESLANQTVADQMTVYIRDDRSTDSTFEIIEQWREKLSIVLIRGENKGPAASFWELLMDPKIQADYYAFCDQDDIWDADKLECGIQRLKKDVHLAMCNCRLIDGEGNVFQEAWYEQEPKVNIIRQFVCGVVQGCAIVFTDALRRHMLENPVNCVPMHDNIVILHSLGFGKVHWEQTPKFSYRMHGKNVVAKGQKSLLKKLKTTWWNWKNSSRHSMSEVAAELLASPLNLTPEEVAYLNHVKTYRFSLRSKIYILKNAYTKSVPWQALRSYYIRVLLNLF